jgi:hypothetical protein
MKNQITRVAYPLVSEAAGPIEIVSFPLKTIQLSGFYLDYALACAAGYEAIVLNFLPGFAPHNVTVGHDFSNLELWSPTKNPETAQWLARKYLDRAVVDVSISDLIEIVTSRIGSSIDLCKPTHKF